MAAVVWFTIALAIWHFTVFVPDRFWGGIEVGTALVAIPGTLIGLAVIYAIGLRQERAAALET
jgi:hypothetical protein